MSRIRTAFTLPELMVSLSVSALLMTGLASALVVAARAVPDEKNTTALAGGAFQIGEQLATELATAISFTVLDDNTVEFRVADRSADVDTSPEVIRYAWDGVAGSNLVRTYNGAPATLLSDVHQFRFTYGTHEETTKTTQTVETTTSEGIVAYFDGWSGISPATQEKTIDSNNWVEQLLTVTPPAGTTKIKFTRARVWMRRDLLTILGNFTIQLHRPTAVGGSRPSSTPLVTAPAISGIGLPLTAYWATATFNDMPITDLSRSDYLLVVKGTSADGVWLSHYQSNSAPDNSQVMYWTSSGGGSWSPTSNFHRQDMRYYLYATYTSESQQPVDVTIKKLDYVTISLQPGSQPGARVDTQVPIYNQPDVTGL